MRTGAHIRLVVASTVVCLFAYRHLQARQDPVDPRASYQDFALHFHLTLPDGWRQVPTELVQRNSDKLGIKTRFDAFFEAPSRPDFSYPYITVETYSLGNEHPTLDEFATILAASESDTAPGAARARGVLPPNLSRPLVDKGKNRIVQEGTLFVQRIGAIKHISTFYLGGLGVACFRLYARPESFAHDENVFNQMLDTLTFDPKRESEQVRSNRRELPLSPTEQPETRTGLFDAAALPLGLIAYWLVLGSLLGLLAHQKNRNWVLWGLFGPLAAVISALTLLFLPTLCPICKRAISDTERKAKHCPMCGAFGSPKPLLAMSPVEPSPLSDSTKRCPYCAEEIKAAAVKCRHCGSTLVTPGQPPA
jgi:predicted RNA-binding Zn-ribbon protein involved in translation (DUF1610 family)